jgi:hypothetical protein
MISPVEGSATGTARDLLLTLPSKGVTSVSTGESSTHMPPTVSQSSSSIMISWATSISLRVK